MRDSSVNRMFYLHTCIVLGHVFIPTAFLLLAKPNTSRWKTEQKQVMKRLTLRFYPRFNLQGVCNFWVCGWSPKAVLSCGAVYYAAQGGSNFWGNGWNPKARLSRDAVFLMSLLKQYFPAVSFIVLYKLILTFGSANKNSDDSFRKYYTFFLNWFITVARWLPIHLNWK